MSFPKITSLITHHLNECDKFVENAAISALNSEGVDNEVIVLSDALKPPRVPTKARLIWDRGLGNASQKVHQGISKARFDSEAFLLMSDDVIISMGAAASMYRGASTFNAIVAPVSNQDNGIRYMTAFELERPDGQVKYAPRTADFVDMMGWEGAVMNYKRRELVENPIFMRVDWQPFFCVLIMRGIWDKVGPLDHELDFRGNDVAWCQKAAGYGIPTLVHFGAFAFHYGSKTLDKLSAAEKAKADEIYMRKMGMKK